MAHSGTNFEDLRITMTRDNEFGADDPDAAIERLDDGELLERAFASDSGEHISKLYHADKTTIESYAEVRDARLALLEHFAFWTREDRAQMKSLYRRSVLASVPSDEDLDELVETVFELRDGEDGNCYTPREARA